MLDASTRIDVLNLLGELKERGLGILFITHDLVARQLHQRPHDDPAPRRRVVELGATAARLRQPAPPVHADRSSPPSRSSTRSGRARRRQPPQQRRARQVDEATSRARLVEVEDDHSWRRASPVTLWAPAAIPWEERPAGSRTACSGARARNPIVAARPDPTREQHLQLCRRAVRRRLRRRLPRRRHQPRHEPPRRPERRRHRLADRRGADRVRADDERVAEIQAAFEHAYDPRVTWLDDRYYVTWCNGYHGPTIGVGYTHDFRDVHQLDNAFLPFNRNGVLFPRRIGGSYAMLSRPSDDGHTPFGDIFYSESPDLVHWGRHRHVHGAGAADVAVDQDRRRPDPDRDGRGLAPALPRRAHVVQRVRLLHGRCAPRSRRAVEGASPGAATTCSRRRLVYEQVGDVPNVVFPCAALVDTRRTA